ncbi:MAG: heme exporter protein CcmD [Betaproteobacteria bacterium]|nr:heme exporter protein CcmD [Betaproteobacteria bacterium]
MNTDFFALGGHGLYVWGSYLVTALVMVVEIVLLRHRRRQAVEILQQEAELAEEITKSNESTS